MDQHLLRFSAREISELAHLQKITLSEKEAAQLVLTFEGWITGILLGTRLGGMHFLLQGADNGQGLQMDRQHLFSYMVHEVFERDPDMYVFLKEASVLQEMTPALCGELLGRSDAAEYFNALEQNGLFVTRRGEGKKATYLCHPVLRELLYDDLRRQLPERFVQLHRRAAELMRANHDYEKAVYHAFEASANDIAAHLIMDSHKQMLTQGNADTLARWIDGLPAMTMSRYPRLLLIRANIHLLVGDYTCALVLLDAAVDAVLTQSSTMASEEMLQLQLEGDVLRSKALFQRGNYHEVLVLCQQLQLQLPADEVKLGADIHMRLGVCAYQLGDFPDAIAHLQKALQLWGRHTIERQTAEVHGALASSYSLLGNFALAEHHISRAIVCWEQLHDEWGKIYNLLHQGTIKQRQGAITEAEKAFNQALTLARGPIHFQRAEAYALVDLGDLYQGQGLYDRSLTMIEDGLALGRRVKDKYLVNFALCILAMTYVYMGDAGTALLLVSETDVQQGQGELLGYEQATRELTYGTILLYQHRYNDAYRHLRNVEVSLHKMGLKQELIQVILRMALCLLEQGQESTWVSRMNEIANLLKLQADYESFVLIELRHLQKLYQAVVTHPEMLLLREQLHLVTEAQKESDLSFDAPNPHVEPEKLPMLLVRVVTQRPQIAIYALGEPVVSIQEKPVARWRMARSMELFFLLLDHGRPMRKEQILTSLWPGVDEQVNQTFHSTIYYLRKALGGHVIVSQGSTYTLDLALNFGEPIWYDVSIFQQQYERAKQALSQEDDVVAREALMSMVELYRGDYVQPFYSDWCTFRRDELRRAYLDARSQLAHLAWRQEQFDECMIHWQHTLTVDDCLEDAHYGLMRCYLRQGKRGLALRQYQRCRDTLQRELGAQPGNAVQNLYQRLMGLS